MKIFRVKELVNSKFFQDFAKFSSSSAIGQILAISLSPFITRIYDATQFSHFAIYSSLVMVIHPIVTGKYEFALVNEKDNEESENLFILCIQLILLFTILIFSIVFLSSAGLKEFLRLNSLGIFQYLIPIGILGQALFTTLKFWLYRYQNFSKLSKSILINATSKSLFLILLGIFFSKSNGLIISNLIAIFITCIFLIKSSNLWISFKKIFDYKKTFFNAKKYWKYPSFNAFPSLLDNLTFEMPVFLITIFYTQNNLADYAIISKIFCAPFAFFTASFSRILLSYSSQKIRMNLKIFQDVKRFLFFLIFLMGIPTIIMMIYSENIIPLIFGQKWLQASIYFRVLLPSIFVREIASSLSTTIVSNNRTELLGLWQVIAFFINLIVLGYFVRFADFIDLIRVISTINCILYLIYITITLYAAKKPNFAK